MGQPNLPYDVTVQISIGAYQPIFRMTAQQQSLQEYVLMIVNIIIGLIQLNNALIINGLMGHSGLRQYKETTK